MSHNKKLAWIFGCGPGALMILNLVLYAVLQFVASVSAQPAVSESGFGAPTVGMTVIKIITVFQSFFGILLIIAIPVGLVLAIVFGTKDSGPQSQPPVQPPTTPPQQ